MSRIGIRIGIGIGLVAVFGGGCNWDSLTSGDVSRSEMYSMNGIKLISSDIAQGNDPSTFSQAQYALSPTRRLLMRFEDLSSHVQSILVDDSHKVEVQLTLTSGQDPDAAKSALKICPISHNWMMLATWDSAAPFGAGERWAQPGGDYDAEGCMTSPERVQDGTLTYDASQWFENYPRGKGENFGLVVIATAPVTIYGDTSGSYSPRMNWSE